MSTYQKTTWVTGDLITAELVNHLENQVESTSIDIETAKSGHPTLDNRITEIEVNTRTLNENITHVNEELASKIDNGYVEDGVAYFESDGQVLFTITGIGGGGSGGGGGPDNPATVTITNSMPWLSTSIREGAACPITFNWSSVIDDIPTGSGSLKVIVNSSICATLNISQGDVTVDVGPYLKTGSNTVRLSLSDAYANARSLIYTINAISLSISSSFDNSIIYDSAFLFPFTPIGAVEKTIYVKLDGVEQETFTTSVSNRQLSYNIPAQTHGNHSIEMWFTAVLNGDTITSNHIYYEYMYAIPENDTPIIITSFNETSLEQYSTTLIYYRIYNPLNPQAEALIKEDNVTKQTIMVGRTEQAYSYRAMTSGAHTVSISSGSITRTFSFSVTAVDINVQAATEGLQLYLTASGRNNGEAGKANWTYNSIAATLSNFNWTSDGWQHDEDGATVLRIKDDARVTIPYKIFESDFRSGGRTIEFEFATHDVRNYDTSIISCISNGRGLNITSQAATFTSEASNIYTQFKEDEHVRIAFAVTKRTEQRLILCYINGIVSGVVQYPDNDDFSQNPAVNITLGCSDATLDIYNIRVYDHDLTRFQLLDNWIADTQNGYLMVERYSRNNIFDTYGNIVIPQLPSYLPYLVITGDLPQYKGNKLIVSGEYVDPLNPTKSFIFENAQIDVQGTSSQYYARKNYKIKFNGGFTYNGTTSSKYAINDDAIPTKTFTFKADVASSEGANNVELARLYNDICPYKTPYQKTNSKIRQGIDGFPIVIFHNNNGAVTFLGKYNFNNDKGTEEVFGFSAGDESWEIKNNTSNRVLWKSSDYSDNDWLNDFEARYPEDNTNPVNLAALATWLKSTDQAQATNAAITPAVTYDGVTYSNDTAAYRLAKFKHELPNHVELDSIIFYYLFTELFLMVDSRAKNAFPSIMGGDDWCILPYDFDTAIGINNEGSLTFSYNLEDIDHLPGGADIFNGQQSVLWINLRATYYDEIKSMYQTLRSNNKVSYDIVDTMFETHQDKWSEAIFNEDAQYKYLDPLINDGDATYLPMLQGSKQAQRKWWLYNRFKYIDSKYNAGDALTDVIQLRGYAKANITVTPYADIYPAIKYGSYLVTERGTRNVATTLINPLDNVNDTEIYIYSCSQLSSIGDISGLKVGLADFSKAVKLQTLKIGDATSGYTNANLTSLTLGNNTLLKSIDVRNCTALTQSVDLTGCTSIEDIYFDGTAITSISLPNGGVIKTLHLPSTITNLTILNHTQITDFTCPDYSNISTLWLDNVSNAVDTIDILEDMVVGGRIRIYNFHWAVSSVSEVTDIYDIFDTMKGLDQNGNNMETAQVYGTIHINNSITGADMALLEGRYPTVTITYDSIASHLYYYDFYGTTLLYDETILNGLNGMWGGVPNTPEDTAGYTFGSFLGWSLTKESGTASSNATRRVIADRKVYAAFNVSIRSYTITFKLASGDGGTTLQSSSVLYNRMPSYKGATPVSVRGEDFVFTGWNPSISVVTGSQTYVAVFIDTSNIVTKLLRGTLTEIDNNTADSIKTYGLYQALVIDQNSKIVFDNPLGITINNNSFYNLASNNAVIPLIKLNINNSLLQDSMRMNNAIDVLELTPTSNINFQFTYVQSTQLINHTILHVDRVYSLEDSTGNGLDSSCRIYIDDTSNNPDSAALAEAYKSATNWSVFSNLILPISEYPFDPLQGTITDSWDQIFQHCANGDVTNYYKLGDTKPLTLSTGQTIVMQIIGFNVDICSDDNIAVITWLSQNTAIYMSSVTGDNWTNSNLRSYLNTTWYNLLPQNIQNNIVEVKKDDSTLSTIVNDKIWTPSREEMLNTGKYKSYITKPFTVRKRAITTDLTAINAELTNWGTRDLYKDSNSQVRMGAIPADGGFSTHIGTSASRYGFAIGFCTGKEEESNV